MSSPLFTKRTSIVLFLHTKLFLGIVFVFCAVLISFSVYAPKVYAVTNVFPGATWATTTPEAVGLDSTKLNTFVDAIDNSSGAAGVIVKNGYIVKTWGNQSSKFDWASAAKPVVSTMLFFALKEGLLASTTDLIYDQGWDLITKDQTMTFHHLANMISGYARGENPGAAWAYNDYGIQLYVKTLFDRVFETTANAAAANSSRLGALQLEDGTLFSSRNGYGVLTTPRTFARIGWLWLNRGNWNGVQVLPQSLFDNYMHNQVPANLPRTSISGTDYLGIGSYGGGSSQTTFGPGFYGYGWWFNTNGTFWPDAPSDTFQANGHFGTEVMTIIPSLDLVVAAKGTWGGYDPGSATSTMNQNLKLLVDSIESATVSLDGFASPTTDTTPSFSGTSGGGSQAVARVEYQIDSTSGSWSGCTASDGLFDETSETFTCTSGALSDGSHTIYVRTTNDVDETSDTESLTFIVDTTSPSVSVTPISPDPISDTTPEITGTGVDTSSTIAEVEYQVDSTSGSWSACDSTDGSFNEASEEFTCTVESVLAEGSHTIYVRATDAAGNVTPGLSYGEDIFNIEVTQSWTQTDWSGGGGQTNWSNATKFSTSTNIATSTAGQITLTPSGGGGGSWYSSSWLYRKQLTINESQVSGSGSLSNFPVLISITDTGLRDHALTNGFDIVFTSADGTTKLDHEIERYTSASGELIAWVRVPTLSATTNTTLYMYYGNGTSSNQQNATGVWDSNYQGVWHLNEVSGNRSDSTSKANTLTDVNTVPQTTGQIGYGTSHDNTLPESLTRTNSNLNAEFPGKVASTAFTASTWVNFDQLNSGHVHNLIVKGTAVDNFLYVELKTACFNFGTATCTAANTVTATSTWYYLTTVYDGTNVSIYVNGVQSGTPRALASLPTGTNLLTIGKREDNTTTRALDGKLDEVRMSNTNRSSDWILTEYNNQLSPGLFHSVGSEEQNTSYASSGSLTSSIFDAGASGIWGNLTYTTTTPSGTTVSVKVRTSNSSTMSGAPSFALCAAVTSGTDISSNNCVTDGHRYIQYEVTLTTSDTTHTPILSDISVAYSISSISPTVALDSVTSPTADNTPVVAGSASDTDGILAAIEYQVDSVSGSWSACTASDGAFDEASETFTCSVGGALTDGSHAIHVRATDNGGLSDVEIVTLFVDTTSPGGVGAPTFGIVSTSSITINQPTAIENGSGLSLWQVRRDNTTELGFISTTTPDVTDSSLSENTEYSYDVQFTDAVGNESTYGTNAQKYTLADTPTNLEALFLGTSSITLTVDSLPHETLDSSGYFFSRADADSGWIQSNSWEDIGLSCGTAYTYEVKYRNGEGVETDSIFLEQSTSECEPPLGDDDSGGDNTGDDTSPDTGSITIVKSATPRDGTNFELSGFDTTFTLDDASTDDADGISASREFLDIATGTYAIVETQIEGWDLTNIDCSGDSDEGSVVNLSERSVEIDLDADENITCTFINTASSSEGDDDTGDDDTSGDDNTDPGDDTEETFQCSDSIDNDSDGMVDYPNDIGCENDSDNDETDPEPPEEDDDSSEDVPQHSTRKSIVRSAQTAPQSQSLEPPQQEDSDNSDTTDDSSAPTIESLLIQLQTLLTELIEAGGTLPPGPLPPTGLPPTYTRDLSVGDSGADVVALQSFLIANNIGLAAQALAHVGSTGYFGPLTQNALAEYQASAGIIPALGYFGPKTRGYIEVL